MQRTVYLRSLNLVRKGQGTAELALASKSLETLHTASALLRSDRTDAATGPAAGDPFTRQLQQKTEEELAELLAAAQQRRPGSGPNGSGAESLDDQEEKEVKVFSSRPDEIGGPKGPEPTRFGDWERGGRCSDF